MKIILQFFQTNRWFKAFVFKWFDDNDISSMEFLKNALIRDEVDGWQLASEFSLFSVSVVDVFTNLAQTQDVIIKLQTPDPEIQKEYNGRLSKTMVAVLTGYDDTVTHNFLRFVPQEKTCCILMNNLNQLRIEMERMRDSMGIGHLTDETLQSLHDMNHALVNRLDSLAIVFASSFEKEIQQKFNEVSGLLSTVTGPGTTEEFEQLTGQQDVISEADYILTPLMDLLDGKLSLFSQACEDTVLKRLLKELWKQVIDTLKKSTIQPPVKRGLLSQGMRVGANLNRKLTLGRSASLNRGPNNGPLIAPRAANLRPVDGNLTPRQCAVLHVALETIKQYFHAGGHGLEDDVLERTSELRSLRYALSLFTQKTETLIRTFINSQTMQNHVANSEGPVGEVKVTIDLYPDLVGSGDHEINVKVISCPSLDWPAKFSFKPYVEVVLLSSGLIRKHATKCKSTTTPEFDESFTFKFPSSEKLDACEIQFVARDYFIVGRDRMLGVTVIQLRDLVKKGSLAQILLLGKQLFIDETGQSILRILSQRTDDETAQEFFRLKSGVRVDPPLVAPKEELKPDVLISRSPSSVN